MALSIVVTPGETFPDGQPADNAALRRGALPTVNLQGAVSISDLADLSITGAKMANDTIDASEKLVDESIEADKVADGGLNADNLIADDYFYAAATQSTAGGYNIYAFVLSPVECNPAAYAAGQQFFFKADLVNDSPVKINVNSIAAVEVKRQGNRSLIAGEIKAGQIVGVIYDGTVFQMTSQIGTTNVEKWVKFTGSTLPSGQAFTVVAATNVFTSASHGMSTGQALTVTAATALAAPLVHTTAYFARVLTANTFTLHPTAADASANTNIIDITTTGTGTQTLYYLAINQASGVSHVIRTPVAETTPPTAGNYTVYYTAAFSGTSYAVNINVKGNASRQPVAYVPASDVASASKKDIRILDLNYTVSPSTSANADYDEVYFTATGI